MDEHPASRPLRSGSSEEFQRALVAHLVEGEAQWVKDSRDLMVAIAPFHDCAQRLGLDVVATFRAAADAGPESLRSVLAQFGERQDVTPAAFGYAVLDGPDGPSYRYA